MSKRYLVNQLYKQQAKRGLTKKKVDDVVETFFLHLSASILRQREFTCTRFGKFKIKKRKKMRVRHPESGQWLDVPSKKTIVFYTSPVLKKKMNP